MRNNYKHVGFNDREDKKKRGKRQKNNYKENVQEASKALADVEKELGNYKAAYQAHVLFKQMADSLRNHTFYVTSHYAGRWTHPKEKHAKH